MHFVCKTTFFLHLRDGFIQKTAVALILRERRGNRRDGDRRNGGFRRDGQGQNNNFRREGGAPRQGGFRKPVEKKEGGAQ
ncbi:MAG: hypothetical protein IJO55_01785 [Lachnospiraceae bacterium]|nr:hypothetical protein [Lachnospiraceae bacterium]